ncbi:MAG: hypothetical protein K0U45_07135 [Alphaproteobacteria bacterium]|nr:hypothetical protein [Alphaproteobacteria bacterium]
MVRKDIDRNIRFIIFAIKQEQKAEAFGFTRNECCRNLKIALHQYWQNKTMGLHGQSQKKNMIRSKKAVGLSTTECIVEHVVPQMVIVNKLMELRELEVNIVEKILRDWYRVCLITKEEDSLLRSNGLRSVMPDGWDGKNVWARYEKVGIELP